MSKIEYISERIINISELESHIRSAYYDTTELRKELEKENPSMGKIGELSKQLHLSLLQAKDFEFCVERRRTRFPDDISSPLYTITKALQTTIDGIDCDGR